MADSSSEFVMHDAIERRCCVTNLESILRRHPNCLEQADTRSKGYGHLPLHKAMVSKQYDVALWVLEHFPQAAEATTSQGIRAIDLCFFNHHHYSYVHLQNTPPEFVEAIVDAAPHTLTTPVDDLLPLTSAIRDLLFKCYSWSRRQIRMEDAIQNVRVVFDRYPEALTNDFEAFEKAIMCGRLDLLQHFLRRCPNILQVPGLPNSMFWACLFGYADIVKFLLDKIF